MTGVNLQKRDRLSYAILHQLWGEYRGEFMDGKLVVNAGLRAPFFKRDLNNFCATSSPTFVECFGRGRSALRAPSPRSTPTIQGPQQRVFKYDAMLPNVGFTFDFMPRMSIFANYAKGLSVPSTDNLYNAFFFAPGTAGASPNPEKTDNFDVGVRYRSPKVQAQLGGFFNRYTDRTASAFDPELNVSTFRNLGKVDKYGIDGYVSYQPIKQLNVYLFGSVLKSEIKDDLIIGECTAAQVAAGFPGCTVVGGPIFAPTAGKRESGAAKYTFGGTVRGTLGSVEIGVTGKRTGPRYIFDTNEPVHAFIGITRRRITIVFPASTPAYWLVNLDARLSLADFGLEKTYLQFNVYNLFDQFYVGGFGGGLNQTITRNDSGAITAYGAPPLRPDRRSAHDQRHPGRRLLIRSLKEFGRRDPRRGGRFLFGQPALRRPSSAARPSGRCSRSGSARPGPGSRRGGRAGRARKSGSRSPRAPQPGAAVHRPHEIPVAFAAPQVERIVGRGLPLDGAEAADEGNDGFAGRLFRGGGRAAAAKPRKVRLRMVRIFASCCPSQNRRIRAALPEADPCPLRRFR